MWICQKVCIFTGLETGLKRRGNRSSRILATKKDQKVMKIVWKSKISYSVNLICFHCLIVWPNWSSRYPEKAVSCEIVYTKSFISITIEPSPSSYTKSPPSISSGVKTASCLTILIILLIFHAFTLISNAKWNFYTLQTEHNVRNEGEMKFLSHFISQMRQSNFQVDFTFFQTKVSFQIQPANIFQNE